MVAIIEYGMGNVLSVQKALDKIGVSSLVTNDAGQVSSATHIVLPGVGSFNKAMQNLHAASLVDLLKKEVIENKKPFLGICLGMQLLASTGYEDGETAGLDFIEGTVKLIPNFGLPVPHIGWNSIDIKNDTYFRQATDKDFYFLHSYWLDAANRSDVAATVNYGCELTAAVQKNNIFGTQFHPEKSHQEGIEILNAFFRLHA